MRDGEAVQGDLWAQFQSPRKQWILSMVGLNWAYSVFMVYKRSSVLVSHLFGGQWRLEHTQPHSHNARPLFKEDIKLHEGVRRL